MVQDGRNTVGQWGGAGLMDAVVCKREVEVVVLGRDVEGLGVAGPDQRKGGKCPGI
jgi:hypothetical protein